MIPELPGNFEGNGPFVYYDEKEAFRGFVKIATIGIGAYAIVDKYSIKDSEKVVAIKTNTTDYIKLNDGFHFTTLKEIAILESLVNFFLDIF
jgi:hypothetical protein